MARTPLQDQSGQDEENPRSVCAGGGGTGSRTLRGAHALQSEFGDAANALAAEYDSIQQEMLWYEAYMDNNELWQEDNETDENYAARLDAYFDALKKRTKASMRKSINITVMRL